MNATTATHDRPETKTVKFNGKTIEYLPDFLKILTSIKDDGTASPTVTASIYTGIVGRNGGQGYGPVWEWEQPVDPRFEKKVNMSYAWNVATDELRKLRGETVERQNRTIEDMAEEFRELDAELAEAYQEECMMDEGDYWPDDEDD
jgi:hypothetical protein